MITLTLVLGLGCSYYYKDYLYNKYLDIKDGYMRIKCSYDKCNKMHLMTHEEYLKRLEQSSNKERFNIYCDGCLDKAFDEFVENEKEKYKKINNLL